MLKLFMLIFENINLYTYALVLLTLCFIAVKVQKKKKKLFFSSIEDAISYSKCLPNNVCNNVHAYAAVVFLPKDYVIDYGQAIWPPKYYKKVVSPRLLLVSTWTNAKLALPGGKVRTKKGETPIQAVIREFKEETGSDMFSDSADTKLKEEDDSGINEKVRYQFSTVTEKQVNHYYSRIVLDEIEFTKMLQGFYIDTNRKGYIDEIFGTVGLPLWMEGPDDPRIMCWDNNAWGLPRLFTSATIKERDEILVYMKTMKIATTDTLQKIFSLCNAIEKDYSQENIGKRLRYWWNKVMILIGLSDNTEFMQYKQFIENTKHLNGDWFN